MSNVGKDENNKGFEPDKVSFMSFLKAVEESIDEKKSQNNAIIEAAKLMKDMVDGFETAGFSHEDAMDMAKTVLSASVNQGRG